MSGICVDLGKKFQHNLSKKEGENATNFI